jgi:hypothetical protein
VGHKIRCLHFHRRCIHGNWIKAERGEEQDGKRLSYFSLTLPLTRAAPSPRWGEG